LFTYKVMKRWNVFPSFMERLFKPIALFFFCAGLIYNVYILGGLSFPGRYVGQDIMANYFKKVDFKKLQPAERNNLIMLYVESLENTFSDVKIVGHDLNAPLNDSLGGSEFSLRQAPGTGWTTAGMVASQCGVPLAPFMGNRLGNRDGPILGKLTCLGDVLDDEGYSQTFLVGPDLKFSGMDKFYLKHGFKFAYGKDQIFEKFTTEDLGTGWGGGINDDTLLDIAFERIKLEHKAQKSFNVTVVTTDNHAPGGFLSPRCASQGFRDQISEVIWCTNKTISNFVEKLKNDKILENTVLIVMGDHNFMGEIEGAKPFGERAIYFNYIAPKGTRISPKRTELTHFDVFPTALQLVLGYRIDQLHLGSNIFTVNNENHSELHNYIFGENFLIYSDFYRSFW
jgi:phosphoglycerol transferase